jgi:hypothetical protein
MLTFILLYIFYLAIRYEHQAARQEAAKKQEDAIKNTITISTISIDDDFP